MRTKLAWLIALSALLSVAFMSWGSAPSSASVREGPSDPHALTPRLYLPGLARDYCSSVAVTDPYFASYQADMRQINADDVWRRCALGNGVVVAVIDTGVSLNHPDLKDNLNAGYDYVDDDAVPEDGNGHGSHVAGIVGAPLNGIGIVGVAPKARILPVRVLDDYGSGYYSWIASGITYAADRAQILNLSLGGRIDSATIRDAVDYAVNKGRLVIAAAGNCGDSYYMYNGCTYMNQPLYPAAYSNAWAVASVNSSDVRSSFSNQGSYVDIAAPGENIYSAGTGSTYLRESGTSQAAPHVSGLAALVWSRRPSYTAAQVRSAIETSAADLGSLGWDSQYGWGRIDALAAYTSTLSASASPAAQPLELPAPAQDKSAEIAPGRVLLRLKPNAGAASLSGVLEAFPGVSIVGQIATLDVQVLRVPEGQEWALIDRLLARPDVLYAEPDYVIRLAR